MAQREGTQLDTLPAQQYGWRNSAPVRLGVGPDGELLVSDSRGMGVPVHDSQVIDESDANNVTITYKLGGITVATKLIAVSGTTTTITLTVV